MASFGIPQLDHLLTFVRNTWGISFSPDQIRTWKADLDGTGSNPRTADQLRSDILRFRVGQQRLTNWLRAQFTDANLTIATTNETEGERLHRLRMAIINGERTFSEISQSISSMARPDPPEPTPPEPPFEPVEPEPTEPEPGDDDDIPEAEPPPAEEPVEERDFAAEAELLYPHLPSELRDVFVEAWIEFGDERLALAKMRSSSVYEAYFPGNRREDGSLRMNETEYAATLDAYSQILSGVGLNPDLFEGRFVSLIEGDVQVDEFAERVATLERRVLHADPVMKGAIAEQLGVELDDQAFILAALDPDLGQQVFTRQLDLAEIHSEASRQSLRLGEGVASMVLAGFGRQGVQMARQFFTQAGTQLPALNTLAERFDSADRNVDVEEFAQARLFGQAAQRQRLGRLLRQSASQFTVGGGIGAVRQEDTGAVTGLTAR